MKKKWYLVAVAIVIVVVISGTFLVINNKKNKSSSPVEDNSVSNFVSSKDFKLSSANYPTSTIVSLTNFEESDEENWQGDAVIDKSVRYEGDSSLSLISTDRQESIAFLNKEIDLSRMEYLEFMAHVFDISSIESLEVRLGDKQMSNYFLYKTSNLNNGWNLVQIPKKQFALITDSGGDLTWDKIQKIEFVVISRPDSAAIIHLDLMSIINDSYVFTKDWRIYNDKDKSFFSLIKKDGKQKLMARNFGSNVAVLGQQNNVRDFEYTATVSPQSNGKVGLFFRGNYFNGYGYYFYLGSNQTQDWGVMKMDKSSWPLGKNLITGDLENEVLLKDKEYWVRVRATGNMFNFFISTNGQEFTKIGEVKDSEFRSGGLGVVVLGGSWGIFDDFIIQEL